VAPLENAAAAAVVMPEPQPVMRPTMPPAGELTLFTLG
jgi:hypothetical protein